MVKKRIFGKEQCKVARGFQLRWNHSCNIVVDDDRAVACRFGTSENLLTLSRGVRSLGMHL